MKSIRIFISSTFRDMHSERDYLVKYVFPELSERCAKRGLHLVPIDLRWGVTQEEAEQGKALEICLEEIEKCRPYFIGILGERYGWVPKKYQVSDYEKFDWLKDFEKGHSITALEIYQGVLKNKDLKTRAFFYFRSPEFMKDVPESKLSDIQSENEENSKKLFHLKENIKDTYDIHKLPGHYTDGYSCQYKGIRINWPEVKADMSSKLSSKDLKIFEEVAGDDNLIDNEEYEKLNPEQKNIVNKYGVVYLDGLEDFGKDVLEDLWQAIDIENPESEILTDPLLIERIQHEAFMHNRTRQFIGRQDILKSIQEHVNNKHSNKPFFLLGEPGTGKSAIMAKAVLQYRASNPEAYTIARFVGISPDSTDIYKLVLNIVEDLASQFAFEIDRERLEKIDTTFDYFRETLHVLSSRGSKILIAIDALNQLHSSHEPQYLKWLPKVLPENINMILSTLDGEYITYAERFEMPVINVGGLSQKNCKEILKTKLDEYRKTLTDEQIVEILKRKDAKKPLYLTVAAEELRVYPDFDLINARIKTLPDTIPLLFEQVLDGLEKFHDKQLVQDALCLIESSMYGLLESELLVLLKRENEEMLPANIWARLYRNISAYLTGAGDSKEGLLNFFHQQFSLAVRERYLADVKTEDVYYRKLSDYGSCWFYGNSPLINTQKYACIYLYKIRDKDNIILLLGNIFCNKECDEKYLLIANNLIDFVIKTSNEQDETLLKSIIEKMLGMINNEYIFLYGLFLDNIGDKICNTGFSEWTLYFYYQFKKFTDKFLLISKEFNNNHVKLTLCRSCARIGNNLLLFGNNDEAFQYFRQTKELTKALIDNDGNNPEYKMELATTFENFGKYYLEINDYDNALENYNKCHDLIIFLVNSDTPNIFNLKKLSSCCNSIALIYLSQNNIEKAKMFSNQGISIIERFSINHNKSLDVFSQYLSAHYQCIGDICLAEKSHNDALEYFDKSEAVLKTSLEKLPDRTDLKNNLSVNYIATAKVYQDLKNYINAYEYYKKGLQIIEELIEDELNRIDFHKNLISAYHVIAKLYQSNKDNPNSITYYIKSLKSIDFLLSRDSNNLEYKNYLYDTYLNIALNYSNLKDFTNALLFYEKCLTINNFDIRINDAASIDRMFFVLSSIVHVCNLLGQKEKILIYINIICNFIEKQISFDSVNIDVLNKISVCCISLGNTFSELNDIKNTIYYYHKGLVTLERLVIHNIENGIMSNLSRSYNTVGLFYCNQLDFEKALEYFNKSVSSIEKVIEINNDDISLKKEFLIALENIISTYMKKNDVEMTIVFIEKAISKLQEMAIAHDECIEFQVKLYSAYYNLGNIFMNKGHNEKGIECFENYCKIIEHLRAKAPNIVDVKTESLYVYDILGKAYKHVGNYNMSNVYFNKDITALKEFLVTSPKDNVQKRLAEGYDNLAHNYLNMKEIDLALFNFQSALDIMIKLVEKTNNFDYNFYLAVCYWNICKVIDNQEKIINLHKIREILMGLPEDYTNRKSTNEFLKCVNDAIVDIK